MRIARRKATAYCGLFYTAIRCLRMRSPIRNDLLRGNYVRRLHLFGLSLGTKPTKVRMRKGAGLYHETVALTTNQESKLIVVSCPDTSLTKVGSGHETKLLDFFVSKWTVLVVFNRSHGPYIFPVSCRL